MRNGCFVFFLLISVERLIIVCELRNNFSDGYRTSSCLLYKAVFSRKIEQVSDACALSPSLPHPPLVSIQLRQLITSRPASPPANDSKFSRPRNLPLSMSDESSENSLASQDQNASLELKAELEIQQPIIALKVNDQEPVTVSENPDAAGFHFLTHEYLNKKVTQDSINEIIDSLPKARSDLLEYLVKNDGTVVCKWCGEVLPSRTHWYRHKYKLHVPSAGLPAGLIKCIKCNTFFKSRKGYVGHCVSRHGSVEEAEREEEEEQVMAKEDKMEVFEETNVEEVSEKIEKEEQSRRNNKLVENFGRGRRKNQIKEERKEDYLKQREKEEKLVAEIIAKVKKECEDQSITMCRRGYSRRSTVMTSFREYDKRK